MERTGGDDDLDAIVRGALAGGAGPRDVERRLRDVPGVTTAELRSGIVKTEPPILELAVELTPDAGPAVRRVYDLVEEPGGAARVVDSHPA